jgi:hypothetical protein
MGTVNRREALCDVPASVTQDAEKFLDAEARRQTRTRSRYNGVVLDAYFRLAAKLPLKERTLLLQSLAEGDFSAALEVARQQ